MKIKELKRTVNVSWSPAEQYPIMLAAGTAAQQVDASFSSNSFLELYSLNLEEPGMDLELKCSLQTQHKFQKLVWSGAGVVVGGCDGGLLQFYNSEKLQSNSSEALVGSNSKHTGNVSALDINPYQKNLLASGASESEIFIWDLNNTSQPMAPGNKHQPYDNVQGLAWNQQVQHILGSTFANRCVVWDLRKNEPIMKLSDSQSRTRWRSLAWHPSVATQLCIASEEDQVPVIQLWDLRLAASPLVTLEGHEKGVMSLSWCRQDPDLLLSAGKDGRILCWNPNNTKPGGEVVVEVSHQSAWMFDVSWCPRSPALLASASFEQQVAVHALLAAPHIQTSAHNQSNMLESFGGAGSLGALPSVASPAPAQPPPQPTRAPRWLRRPAAARFAFGGRLVTVDRCPQEAGAQRTVYISQVVSEPEIVEKAAELDHVLSLTLSREPGAVDTLAEYCRQRGEAAAEQHDRYIWYFLRASFLPTFRTEVLNLLGFKQDEIPSKFKSTATPGDTGALSRGESLETEGELSTDTSTDLSDAPTLMERKLANLHLSPSASNVVIPNGQDSTSLICRALVCGNLEEAVELCLDAGRVADALIIASLGSQELLYKVQKYHLNATAQDPVSLLSGSLLQSQWESLVQLAAPANWKDTLAALVTHCDEEALAHYCESLGAKLSQESEPALRSAATLCYVCAARGDALPAAGAGRGDSAVLARRAELALLMRCAAAARGRDQQNDKVDVSLHEYASRLAEQGCLQSALAVLQGVRHDLHNRLLHALRMHHQNEYPQQPQQGYVRARTLSAHSTHSQHARPPHVHQPQLTHKDLSNAFGSGVPVAADASSWQTQQTARPPSVGLHAAHPGGITSRSKYKVDPSVHAAPAYGQYSYNNPVTSQPQAYGGYNSPLPDQYSAASVPTLGYSRTPANTINPINPVPLNPMNSLNPVPLNPLNPAPMNQHNTNQLNPLNPTPMNPMINTLNPAPMNSINPTANGGYMGSPGMEVLPPVVPVPRSVAPGWNDPPMMSSKPKQIGTEEMSAMHAGTRQWSHIIETRRHLEPKQEVTAQAPITHPLFGVEPPQHVPLQPQLGGQQYQPQYYPEQHNYAQYAQPQPAYNQQVESQPLPEPVQVQKQPIPEQHVIIQTVFDSLKAECSNLATNPQMKKKLDDVQRRLETLYDLLREYRLSEGALSSLHTCAAGVQAREYAHALQCATSLATGADFAAAAGFLPGLKLLLQLAMQLQPYAR